MYLCNTFLNMYSIESKNFTPLLLTLPQIYCTKILNIYYITYIHLARRARSKLERDFNHGRFPSSLVVSRGTWIIALTRIFINAKSVAFIFPFQYLLTVSQSFIDTVGLQARCSCYIKLLPVQGVE